MNYPIWELPTIGGGSLIAIIAILHVFIAHLAVGGGLFLDGDESPEEATAVLSSDRVEAFAEAPRASEKIYNLYWLRHAVTPKMHSLTGGWRERRGRQLHTVSNDAEHQGS